MRWNFPYVKTHGTRTTNTYQSVVFLIIAPTVVLTLKLISCFLSGVLNRSNEIYLYGEVLLSVATKLIVSQIVKKNNLYIKKITRGILYNNNNNNNNRNCNVSSSTAMRLIGNKLSGWIIVRMRSIQMTVLPMVSRVVFSQPLRQHKGIE